MSEITDKEHIKAISEWMQHIETKHLERLCFAIDSFNKFSAKDKLRVLGFMKEKFKDGVPSSYDEFFSVFYVETIGYKMFIFHDRYGLSLNTMKKAMLEAGL